MQNHEWRSHAGSPPTAMPADRDARGRFVKPGQLAQVYPDLDDKADPQLDDIRTADGLLAKIGCMIEGREVLRQLDAKPELPPEPLLSDDVLHGAAGNRPALSGSVDQIGNSDFVLNYPDMVGVARETSEVARAERDRGVVPQNDPPKVSRAIHLRRQLEAAAEHGATLLAALGLPRLVDLASGISRVDPIAAGDALDQAIDTLDALDGDADREDGGDAEPSLGWTAHVYQTAFNIGGTTDVEHDTADAEPSLASPERHPEVPVWFSNEVYTVCGGSEGQLRWAEGARDDREKADEDGPIDEDELDGAGDVDPEPSIGWPEDFTAEVVPMLEAGADAEHDDADSEDDRCEDDSGLRLWMFGPSRREVAHV